MLNFLLQIYICWGFWVYLFFVETGDMVSRSNPMRHSHFTNHVAMAVVESYITFFKTLLASDHPLPKQPKAWLRKRKWKNQGGFLVKDHSYGTYGHFSLSEAGRNMFCKKNLKIWKKMSVLEISSVFKDIVLAVSEFYPHAQWRANTAGHSTTRETQKRIPSIFIIQYNIIHRINVNCVCTCE